MFYSNSTKHLARSRDALTAAARNAPNPGNCFPFVFFLYYLIPSINWSGLYFQCNKSRIVKGEMETRDFNNFPCVPPEGFVPSSSRKAKPPSETLGWREEAAGFGRTWPSESKTPATSFWQNSSKPLCLPIAATGAGRSLNPER